MYIWTINGYNWVFCGTRTRIDRFQRLDTSSVFQVTSLRSLRFLMFLPQKRDASRDSRECLLDKGCVPSSLDRGHVT